MERLPFNTIALAALLACVGISPLRGQDAAKPGGYARAEALVRNHQWDEGLAILAPMLKAEPRNARVLNLAGLAYTGKGDTDKADGYFRRSLAAEPGFLPALKNLAVNEFNAGRDGLAETHLLEAEKESPNDAVVNLFLGQLAYRQRKFKLASECLDRAGDLALGNAEASAELAVSRLQSDGKPIQGIESLLDRIPPAALAPQTQAALGASLAQAEMPARALPYLQAVFTRFPDSYDAGFNLALTGVQAKDYPTAIRAGEELIQSGKDTSELENVLAEAFEGNGQTQRAVDAYRKAIDLDPGDEDNYLDFASLCLDRRAFDDGMKVVTVGLQNRPNSERLTFLRGIVYAMQDHFELAEKDFQQAALLEPKNDLGYVGLGVTYLELGNSEKAIQILRERLRQRPDDANLQYLLGEGLIRSGAAPGQPAYAEAQGALEKSVRLNPKLCLPHISLGSIYLEEDRLPEAAAQLEQARAIDPSEKSSYSHLAVVYRRLNQPEKAKEALNALKQVLDRQRAGMRVKVKAPDEGQPDESDKPEKMDKPDSGSGPKQP